MPASCMPWCCCRPEFVIPSSMATAFAMASHQPTQALAQPILLRPPFPCPTSKYSCSDFAFNPFPPSSCLCTSTLSCAAFVRNEPPLEADDAHWLLDFYSTFDAEVAIEEEGREAGAATTQRALECLARIKGSFAFIVYDAVHVSAACIDFQCLCRRTPLCL